MNEKTGAVVRSIFDLLTTEGCTLRAIVHRLLAEQVPPPKKSWTWTTVYRILTNPSYKGQARYRRLRVAERRGKKRIFEQRDRSEWLAVPVPRIVFDDVWEQAQLQLRRHRAESPRRQRRFYLLKGLVRCSICGYIMVGKPSGKALYYTCYVGPELRKAERRCSWHAVPARSLEQVVWDQIVLALSQPELIVAEARRYRESHVSERDQLLMRLDYVKKALHDIPLERERALSAYRQGYASDDELKKQIADAEDKRARLKDEQRALETKLDMDTVDSDHTMRLERVVAQVSHRLRNLTPKSVVGAAYARTAWVPTSAQ